MTIENNVKFNKQIDILEEWLELWPNECRRVFIEKLLSCCSGVQLEFLFSVTEPLHHRGFIYSAQTQLKYCPPISTPTSRHEALVFNLQNISDKYYRPKSAVLKSKDDIDRIINDNESNFSTSSGGLFKTRKSKQISKKRSNEIQSVLDWYDNHWTDSERQEMLYLVLCMLSVHELYHATLILTLRRWADFLVQLPQALSLTILSYLSPKDIINCSEVSKEWYKICTSDMIWSLKCAQNNVSPNNPDNRSQQDLFKNNVFLQRNWEEGKCRVSCFSGLPCKVVSVAYDVRTGKIATGFVNGLIKIWSISKSGGSLIATLLSHSKSVWCVEWYKANCLLSCSSDGSIKIWNVKKGLCQKSIEGHDGKVWCIKCDNDVIYSGGDDKLVKCYDIKRCELVQKYEGHNGSVFALDLNSPDQLISGSADKTMRIWSCRSGECLRTIWLSYNSPGWVMSLSVSRGHVAAAFNDKISIYHIDTGVLVKTLPAHKALIECVQMYLDSDTIQGIMISGSKDKTIKYRDIASGTVHTLEGHKDIVHALVYTPDKIISVSADSTLKIWDFSACTEEPIRRKTVVSGGMGQIFLYEYPYDEHIKYESQETKLYKKHLAYIKISKQAGDSDDQYSETPMSGMTPVEITSY